MYVLSISNVDLIVYFVTQALSGNSTKYLVKNNVTSGLVIKLFESHPSAEGTGAIYLKKQHFKNSLNTYWNLDRRALLTLRRRESRTW